MKLLGHTKKKDWYGRQKGVNAPIQIMVYPKKKAGKLVGRPDFRDIIKSPHISVLGKKPPTVSNRDWQLKLNEHHWDIARAWVDKNVQGVKLEI